MDIIIIREEDVYSIITEADYVFLPFSEPEPERISRPEVFPIKTRKDFCKRDLYQQQTSRIRKEVPAKRGYGNKKIAQKQRAYIEYLYMQALKKT